MSASPASPTIASQWADPLIVTVAPNGAYKQPADHSAVPITPATLATTAKACLDAGAAMLHMHIRDAQGRHSLDVEGYREAQRVVRQAVGDAMVIQITSEAAGVYQAPAQIAMVEALQPEAVSIGLREVDKPEIGEAGLQRFFTGLAQRGLGARAVGGVGARRGFGFGLGLWLARLRLLGRRLGDHQVRRTPGFGLWVRRLDRLGRTAHHRLLSRRGRRRRRSATGHAGNLGPHLGLHRGRIAHLPVHAERQGQQQQTMHAQRQPQPRTGPALRFTRTPTWGCADDHAGRSAHASAPGGAHGQAHPGHTGLLQHVFREMMFAIPGRGMRR